MWTTFEGMVVQGTGAAVLFQGQYWGGPLWFPRSQVIIEEDHAEDYPDNCVVIKVKSWLTNKNGLHEFTNYSTAELEAMS
jgi:hypothetical protein